MENNQNHFKENIFFMVLQIIGLALVMFTSLHWGVGFTYDSAIYFEGAESIVDHFSFSRINGTPITLYPPFFSIVLALFYFLGVPLLTAATLLNVSLLSVNIYLLVKIIGLITESKFQRGIAFFFFFFSPVLLEWHLRALTEPLFLSLCLLAFICLTKFVSEIPRNPFFLYFSAILFACSTLTRHVGWCAIIGGLAILIDNHQKLPRKYTSAVLFLIIATLFPCVWFLRNQIVGGNALARPFAIHLFNWQDIMYAFSNITRWIAPRSFPEIVRYGMAAISLILLSALVLEFIFSRKRKESNDDQCLTYQRIILMGATAFGISYLIIVLGTIAFLDRLQKFDPRILLPLYISLCIFFWTLVVRLREFKKRDRYLKQFALSFLLAVCIISVPRWFILLEISYKEGFTQSSKYWHESSVLHLIRNNYGGFLIYSNMAPIVQFWTNTPIHDLPKSKLPLTGSPNINVNFETDALRKSIKMHNGMVVLCGKIPIGKTYNKKPLSILPPLMKDPTIILDEIPSQLGVHLMQADNVCALYR